MELYVLVALFFVGYVVVSVLWPKKTKPEGHQSQERSAEEPKHETRYEEKLRPWYEVLGVSPTATDESIRQAYRTLISQYHPDKVASLAPEFREIAHRRTIEINEAMDTARKQMNMR